MSNPTTPYRSPTGVWMVDENTSVSRFLVVMLMVEIGFDPNDFRRRDRLINTIGDYVDGMLDAVAGAKQ